MLRELHISNLAVITDARVELDAGLNCFTGATGAGKSLVIGAIEVLLALRSASDLLRAGADEGRVSGVFELARGRILEAIEQITDLNLRDEGGQLLLTRRLYASGRSSISLNGNPITLGMLKQVAELLIDVHGQHDHQFLLKPSNQLDVLDQFGALSDLRQQYQSAFTRLRDAAARVAELTANRELRRQQLDLYRFQASEIDAAELDATEYQELTHRSTMLKNLEKLKKEAGAIHAALYEADGSVLERLKIMVGILGEISAIDSNLQNTLESMRGATIQLEEVAFDLSRYLDRLDLDPAELAQVEDRLNAINRVLNKYGQTIEAADAFRSDIGQKIAELERATDDLATSEKQIGELRQQVSSLGAKLSDARRQAARKLAPPVVRQLSELGMDKAQFSVAFEKVAEDAGLGLAASPAGMDQVEFLVQTNPGQPTWPLRKIASGGEMSRIMLALKSMLAQTDRVSVLVFDEIDANVGGRLGSVIGQKLRDLSRHHQVLCITHLPQIACYADRHLTVRKAVQGKSTETSVRVMSGDERIEELAEMIGGQHVTQTTLAQARELLDGAGTEADRRRKRK